MKNLQYFKMIVMNGWQERVVNEGKDLAKYQERLSYEIEVVMKLKLVNYFLIVYDSLEWSRKNNILIGVGRGSSSGSLICYLMGITQLDPIVHGLFFERFLNVNRADMADIDIDVQDDRRAELFAYLRRKYGYDKTSQIGTFGYLSVVSAFRDVCSVMEIPSYQINELSKLIVDETSFDEVPELRSFARDHPEIIKHAKKLDGVIRNVGTHAAGLVISSHPIETVAVIEHRKDSEVCCWDKKTAEAFGLLKMDFLGLSTLTVLNRAKDLIKNTRGVDIDLYKIPLDDELTIKEFQAGNSIGIFQFEKGFVQDVLRSTQPKSLDELAQITALCRPGPMTAIVSGTTTMLQQYVKVASGSAYPDYEHELLKDILESTNGVLCLHENSLVSMADGSEKKISDVKIGDIVMSVNEDSKKTEPKECHGCAKTVFGCGVELKLENNYSVVLTEDHKVLTWRGMIEARQLLDDDVIAVPSIIRDSSQGKDIFPWLGSDEDVAYLLGYISGNGCYGSSVTLCCGEEYKADILFSWIKNCFKKINVKKYFNTRAWYLGLSSKELTGEKPPFNRRKIFNSFINSTGLNCHCKTKTVPHCIMTGNMNIKKSYLAGIMDSDGHIGVNKKGHTVSNVSTSSLKLKSSLRRLFSSIGVETSIRETGLLIGNPNILKRELSSFLKIRCFLGRETECQFRGRVPSSEIIKLQEESSLSKDKFGKKFGFTCYKFLYESKLVYTGTANKFGVFTGDLKYFKIKTIKKIDNQQFYSMSVSDNHNLIANGIVVSNCYQEQTMELFQKLAGFSLAEADEMRKIIGRKMDAEAFEPYKDKFVSGGLKNGFKKELSTALFEELKKYSLYQFNKSHAISYAYNSFSSMYLKVHFPVEYMASLLSFTTKRSNIPLYIRECDRLGIEVIMPDINLSTDEFNVVGDKIVAPLSAIKGVGDASVKEIIMVRGDGFKSVDDFVARVAKKQVNKGKVETLIKAGAFASLGFVETDQDILHQEMSQLLEIFNKLPSFDLKNKVEEDILNVVANRWEACSEENKLQLMGPVYGKHAPLMIINKPSATEKQHLTGKLTSTILDRMRENGITKGKIYYTGGYKCKAVNDKGDFPQFCQDTCPAFLNDEILAIRPKVILLCDSRFQGMFVSPKLKWYEIIGNVYYVKKYGTYVIPSFTPQQVAYRGDEDMTDTFNEICEKIGHIFS